MPTETLHFENARVAQQLFNNDPRNLDALEQQLGVRATAREGWIKLDGAAEAIERARQLFVSLESSLKAGTPVRNREFTHALNVVKHEGASMLKDLMNDRVQTHEKKPGVTAKTVGQKNYLEAIRKHDITFGIGPAGTGKTYLAVAMAVNALLNKQVSRIILTRPAVEAGEKLGFLPGTLQEKIDPYLRPLYDALFEMLDADKVEKYLERNVIEVAPIAFMRGRTLNDSFIILDEAQNSTPEQMKMVLTRQGFNSKMLITGDITQIDLPVGRGCGLLEAMEVLRGIDEIRFVYFDERDVVRHTLVQKIIRAYDRYQEATGLSRQMSLRWSEPPQKLAAPAAEDAAAPESPATH